jgi:hypothetical protein
VFNFSVDNIKVAVVITFPSSVLSHERATFPSNASQTPAVNRQTIAYMKLPEKANIKLKIPKTTPKYVKKTALLYSPINIINLLN